MPYRQIPLTRASLFVRKLLVSFYPHIKAEVTCNWPLVDRTKNSTGNICKGMQEGMYQQTLSGCASAWVTVVQPCLVVMPQAVRRTPTFKDTAPMCKSLIQAPEVSSAKAGSEGRKRIAVLGASGYTGEEVVRLLALHPVFDVTVLTGESQAGKVSACVCKSHTSLGRP